MSSINIKNLWKRKGGYYFRMYIPKRYHTYFDGKEIKISLKTSNYDEAILFLEQCNSIVRALFMKIDSSGGLLDKDYIRSILLNEIKQMFSSNAREFAGYEYRDYEVKEDQTEVLREKLIERDYEVSMNRHSKYLDEAKDLALRHNIQLSDDDFERNDQLIELSRIAMRLSYLNARNLWALSGDRDDASIVTDPVILSYIEGDSLALPTNDKETMLNNTSVAISASLSELFESYSKERSKSIDVKTLETHEQHMDTLIFVLGDIQTDTLDKKKALEFKQALFELPPHRTKRYAGYSLEKLRAMYKAEEIEGLSTRTINNHITNMNTICTWGKANGYLTENPFVGMKVKVKKSEKKTKNLVYDDEQLKQYFSSPAFKGCLNKRDRSKAGDLIIKDELYWYPLIALYAGLRLEEICQMEAQDVCNIEGVWCFDINDDGDYKRLKTENSKRIVPVHDSLLDLGILEFFKIDSKVSGDKLWDVKRSPMGKYSEPASKRLSCYRKAIGIPETHTFHSFRATFINELKQSKQELHIVKALVGHEQDDLTFDGYANKYKVNVLKSVVDLIDFDLEILNQ
ncbi:MAG: site-specific integrase [Pseudomonadota bacterium]|nr:site-specific integrase [Pseudomonadota bacterium]